MYTVENFPTKKAMKIAHAQAKLEERHPVEVYQPGGIFHTDGCPDGYHTVEGPHNPEPHTWWSRCKIEDGVIISIK